MELVDQDVAMAVLVYLKTHHHNNMRKNVRMNLGKKPTETIDQTERLGFGTSQNTAGTLYLFSVSVKPRSIV